MHTHSTHSTSASDHVTTRVYTRTAHLQADSDYSGQLAYENAELRLHYTARPIGYGEQIAFHAKAASSTNLDHPWCWLVLRWALSPGTWRPQWLQTAA